jgi:hypothetical protein
MVLALLSLLMLGSPAGCKARDDNTTLPTATATALQISLQNVRFGNSDPLGVLVKNTGKSDVYALNGNSRCTILQLQQYDASKRTWMTVNRCRDVLQPIALAIRAGMSESFTLAPGSSSDPNTWQSGEYRIALIYSSQIDGKTSAETAYSQGFMISG